MWKSITSVLSHRVSLVVMTALIVIGIERWNDSKTNPFSPWGKHRFGYTDQLSEWLSAGGDPNAVDGRGDRLLQNLLYFHTSSSMHVLVALAEGADPDKLGSTDELPLERAALNGDLLSVVFLVEYGADLGDDRVAKLIDKLSKQDDPMSKRIHAYLELRKTEYPFPPLGPSGIYWESPNV